MAGKDIKFGKKSKRRVYSSHAPFHEMDSFYLIQTNSFNYFVDSGIKEAFEESFPINANANITIDYISHRLDMSKIDSGEMVIENEIDKKGTYAAPLLVLFKYENTDTGEVEEREVFICNLPLMTPSGSFIINGVERVIVSQLSMAPGLYLPKRSLFSLKIRKEEGNSIKFKVSKNKGKNANSSDVSIIFDGVENIRDIYDSVIKIDLIFLLRVLGISKEDINNYLLYSKDFETNLDIYLKTKPLYEKFDSLLDGDFDDDITVSKLKEISEYIDQKIVDYAANPTNKKLIEEMIDDKSSSISSKKDSQLEDFEYLQRTSWQLLSWVQKSYERKWFQLKELGKLRINDKLSITSRIQHMMVANEGGIINNDGEIVLKENDRITHSELNKIDEEIKKGTFTKEIDVDFDIISKILSQTHTDIIKFKIVSGIPKESDDVEKNELIREINAKLEKVKEISTSSEEKKTLKEKVSIFKSLLTNNTGKAKINVIEIYKDYTDYLEKRKLKVVGTPYISEKSIDKEVNRKFGIAEIFSILSFVQNTYIFDEQYSDKYLYDNEDELTNKTVRGVGQLLKNEFKLGLYRIISNYNLNPVDSYGKDFDLSDVVFNHKPISSVIKTFFASNQLSQFMDQVNPLAELTHKRRLSSLGKGGVGKNDTRKEIRDITGSYYGRICPIETPEGFNIGIINTLALYARLNEYGLIVSPYIKVEDGKVSENKTPVYLSADKEKNSNIAQATEALNELGEFQNEIVAARVEGDPTFISSNEVDYVDFLPQQAYSISTSSIPFLERDDANRALMGANMQRQAVPLLKTDSPIVGTGIEYISGKYSGAGVVSEVKGTVTFVDASRIVIEDKDGNEFNYKLRKFLRTNQGTCQNQSPIVKINEKVNKGDVIADGFGMQNGELALGKNPVIAFTTWEGYNFEDAIVISENLVKDDVYTSLHLDVYEISARKTKLGDEKITNEIPNVSEEQLSDLDSRGIIRVGSEVGPNSILVGKVTPKGESDETPHKSLVKAIFGQKSGDVKDASLRMPNHGKGVVHKIVHLKEEDGDNLPNTIVETIYVYVIQKRKIKIGDKMAGRHGNKGIVSIVVPEEDMPFLEDGTPVDILLNPLGVPSRMNIGQVLESHLGMAAKMLSIKVATPVFDGVKENDLLDIMKEANLPEDGKFVLYDGRTGEKFDKTVSVGVMYFMKLNHLVDDKMHARSTGSYTSITKQPLGGKSQFGGQRFGEMEVWALEAYGAAKNLKELMTIKSDDIEGRNKIQNSILNGTQNVEEFIPEAFNSLILELYALGIDLDIVLNDGTKWAPKMKEKKERQ